METEINLWKPIEFAENWLKTDTSKLDNLLPSWYRKREVLKSDSKEYTDFLTRLKRQHAIETGIVARLYDLNEEITEKFIKEGFVESYIQHGDTNIPPAKLMSYLQDHFEAINFIFDVVTNKIPISQNFILQLHQLITRNQDYSEAIDTLGNHVREPLLKGKFKTNETNPRRSDETRFIYCSPVHVESEVERLISIYSEKETSTPPISPIIIAAWFHHSFSIIHPFQDGNGRVARLLASFILIKHGLFPFTVKRNEKKRYTDSLERADSNQPNELVEFFSNVQKRNIESVLNLNLNIPSTPYTPSISEIASALSQKVNHWKKALKEDQIKKLKNRTLIFNYCDEIIRNVHDKLKQQISEETARISLTISKPDSEKDFYFTHQIIDYAKKHNYFFNRLQTRGWFGLSITLSEKKQYQERQYQIIISMHHYGYDDTTLAIGAFLEYKEPKMLFIQKQEKGYKTRTSKDYIIASFPLDIEPYTLSIEGEIDKDKIKQNLHKYIQDTITIASVQIMNEIN